MTRTDWVCAALVATWIALALIVIQPWKHLEWGQTEAAWAQFLGSVIALVVVAIFSRQEALDRRAEAKALSDARTQEVQDREAAARTRLEKWVAVMTESQLLMHSARRAFEEAGEHPENQLIEIPEVRRYVSQAWTTLSLFLTLEPPNARLTGYLSAAREFIRRPRDELKALEYFENRPWEPQAATILKDLHTRLRIAEIRLRDLVEEYYKLDF